MIYEFYENRKEAAAKKEEPEIEVSTSLEGEENNKNELSKFI